MIGFLLQDADANATSLSDTAPPSRAQRYARLCTLRYAAVLLYRSAQLAGRRSGILASLIKQVNQALTGADLAWQAQLGPGLVLRHPVGVVIGMGVRAGAGLRVQQGVTLGGDGQDESAAEHFPQLGRDVRIGPGACVLGGVSVGDAAVIGANAVVIRDVAPGAFAVGVPAHTIPTRTEDAA